MKSIENVTPRPWGQGCLTWELLARPDMVVFHERMPPGTAELAHHHAVARQFFFVLTGSLVITIDGTEHRLARHEGLEVPPGAVHKVRNASHGETEFLAIAHPSTLGDRTNAEGG